MDCLPAKGDDSTFKWSNDYFILCTHRRHKDYSTEGCKQGCNTAMEAEIRRSWNSPVCRWRLWWIQVICCLTAGIKQCGREVLQYCNSSGSRHFWNIFRPKIEPVENVDWLMSAWLTNSGARLFKTLNQLKRLVDRRRGKNSRHFDCIRRRNAQICSSRNPPFPMWRGGKAEGECAVQLTRKYHWYLARSVWISNMKGASCASLGLAGGCNVKLNCGGAEGCVHNTEREHENTFFAGSHYFFITVLLSTRFNISQKSFLHTYSCR